MTLILTFLGKGGTGRTTVAIAAAKRQAAQGQRVLLVSQDASPVLRLLLGPLPDGPEPHALTDHLEVVQFQSTHLLEQSWETMKELEAQHVRTPFFKEVFGQELGILPGMDQALALNALREYVESGRYDTIVYDGAGDLTTLRMFGMPSILSWYLRRFRTVVSNSDLARALSPFLQPISAAIFHNITLSSDNFGEPTNQVNDLLDRGKAALADPQQVIAYLVTTGDAAAIAMARYLWGSAQQIGLTVGGVILNQGISVPAATQPEFSPLPLSHLPQRTGEDWQPLLAALPDFANPASVPAPMSIDISGRKVSLFLPGFEKKQVKLTQYGPEITIEAGDQRHNVFLPPELSGRPVAGAKFQDGYLIISFG
ncbi:Get3/ArsA fold putative tail anchor-mediating ATPase NosAFP [Trichothermofontia sp.]